MTDNQTSRKADLSALVESLCGKPIGDVYSADKLLRGIELEKNRLGAHRYLAMLTQHVFDIDGQTDWVYLLESFDSQVDAVNYVEDAIRSVMESQTEGKDEYGMSWALESAGELPVLLPAKKSGDWAPRIRVVYDRTYKIRGMWGTRPSPYDSIYNCFRVIGPFRDEIVSKDLFGFVEDPFELQMYFQVLVEEGLLHNKMTDLFDSLPKKSPLVDTACQGD